MSTVSNSPCYDRHYPFRSTSLQLSTCEAPSNYDDELLPDLWNFANPASPETSLATSPLTPRSERPYMTSSPQFLLPRSNSTPSSHLPLKLTLLNLINYNTPAPQETTKRLSTTSLTSCITSNSEESLSSTTSASSVGSTEANSPLYKTELCASFLKNGECPYDLKCQFAHGVEELRCVRRLPKYRSKPCVNWLRSGSCRYGLRCCFKH